MNRHSKILVELGKVRLTSFVAISASIGYILATGQITLELLLPVFGVFLLSWGSSAFNQIQEWQYDAKMNRTKHRPLPTREIDTPAAIILALTANLAGLAILMLTGSPEAVLLGLLAIFWYNAVYTPLKRKTALAAVPGALLGAIPPAIGWVVGGGAFGAPQMLAVSLFFFIWQIPHFWLLLLLYENDYRRAGFPVLTDIFSRPQLKRITFAWIVALAVSCLMIPLAGASQFEYTFLLLFGAGGILVWRMRDLLKQYYVNMNFKLAFMDVNIYVLVVVILLSLDKLLFS